MERFTSIEQQIDKPAASQYGMSEHFLRRLKVRDDAAAETLRAEALDSALQARFEQLHGQMQAFGSQIEQERRDRDLSGADLEDFLKRHMCLGDECACSRLGDEDGDPEEVVDAAARKLVDDNRRRMESIAQRHQSRVRPSTCSSIVG